MTSLPKLRSDLVIKEQTIKNVKSFIIKDPVNQRYFRYEAEEHFVITQLDGEKNAAGVAELYNERFHDELTANDIKEFLESIRSNEFFEKTKEEQNIFLYEKLKEQRRSRIIQAKGSAMYFRIPVWDPDRFFDKVIPYIGWIWSPKFVWFMNLFMLFSVGVLLNNLQAVGVGLAHIFDFSSHTLASILFLWVTVLGTIAIHELGHGLTCKRFGGECHEIGFLFMFFNPCLYANVNDAWLFEERSRRLYVTFAGCYVEFLFGFIMMYLWLLTQPGTLINIVSFQVVVVSFFSAIFMNFNPLMKFDGYFALSDALEMPNLRDRSRDYLKYVIQTKVFRLEREFDFVTQQEQWIFLTYGSLVTIYLTNVFIGLGFMIGGMMTGVMGKIPGILVTCWIMYKLLGRYFFSTLRFIKVLMVEHKTFFAKKVVRVVGGILGVGVMGVCLFVPFSLSLDSESTLEPVHDSIIRSLASGYVEPMEHWAKREFKKGEVLLTLNNRTLGQQRADLQLDIKVNEVLLNQAIAQGNAMEIAKLRQSNQKLNEILIDLNRQYDNLTIYSPFDGVLEDSLVGLENTYLNPGDPIGRLIDPTQYQATLHLQERDLEGVVVGTSAQLALDAHGDALFQGEITKIATSHQKKGIARMYQVTVTFPNENLFLRSGLDGTVSLNIGEATVLQRLIRWVQKTVRLDLQL